MFASVLSAAIIGVKGRLIRVEADVCAGPFRHDNGGLRIRPGPGRAQERVKAALRNSGAVLPPGGLP